MYSNVFSAFSEETGSLTCLYETIHLQVGSVGNSVGITSVITKSDGFNTLNACNAFHSFSSVAHFTSAQLRAHTWAETRIGFINLEKG